MTVTASNYTRRENDLYQTEPWATEALLSRIPDIYGLDVWEPAAGNHLIADTLRDHGANVITSDIARYDRDHTILEPLDFLGDMADAVARPDLIITNPPYGAGNRTAVKFIERALDLADEVAMLLTANFDSGKTRSHLFGESERFHSKIVLLDRLSWTLDGQTGTGDHAWFYWRKSNIFEPTIRYEEKPNGAE